jgi:predicted site-specific integrase-resolvase
MAKITGISYETLRSRVRRGAINVVARTCPREHFRVRASVIRDLFPEEWANYLASI